MRWWPAANAANALSLPGSPSFWCRPRRRFRATSIPKTLGIAELEPLLLGCSEPRVPHRTPHRKVINHLARQAPPIATRVAGAGTFHGHRSRHSRCPSLCAPSLLLMGFRNRHFRRSAGDCGCLRFESDHRGLLGRIDGFGQLRAGLFQQAQVAVHIVVVECADAGRIPSQRFGAQVEPLADRPGLKMDIAVATVPEESRSEEHTSELQSLAYLVCRLLLEKKK